MRNQQTKFDLDGYLAFYQPITNEGVLKQPFEFLGLITAICSSPKRIAPSEWYPFIWNNADSPACRNSQVADQLLGYLLQWSNYCNGAFMQQHALDLPQALRVDDAGVPTDELSDFAHGYLVGQEYLKEVWEAFIPDEQSQEYSMLGVAILLMMQCTRHNIKISKEYQGVVKLVSASHSTMSISIYLTSVGMLAREFDVTRRQQSSAPYHTLPKRTGRNDPCPCGSGRKYKKCCLN